MIRWSLAAYEAQSVEASLRLPLSADVEMTDRLRVIRPEHAAVSGIWEVTSIRPNRAHTRVMLKRVQLPDWHLPSNPRLLSPLVLV
jgi:hypothetical protein